jgi:plastocyanin
MNRRYADTITRALRTMRSRRNVLGTATRGVAGGLGAALITRGLGSSGLDAGPAATASAQASACSPAVCPTVADPLIRRNVFALSASEIASLRRGVAVMKQRPQSDPTSWAFQANLHAVPVLMPEPIWCQHRSWFFFPWHRIYLYWFERILREASGDPELTLPYWNYSDDAALRVLPPAFGEGFDADGSPNPLFEARRAPGINDGSLALSALTVAYEPAFSQINFFSDADPPVASFGGPKIPGPDDEGPGAGTLEGTPHGGIHVDVGGVSGIFDHVFETEGSFEYHCSLHPSETGRITVSATAPTPEGAFVRIRIDRSRAGSIFDPPDVTVPVGFPVVWINSSFEFPHSATANEGAFDSGLLEPPGIMRFPQLAARDPIFWLHHANIDRLWERWLARKNGRTNPIDQCAWMDQAFPFYNEKGEPVSMAVKDVLDMVNCLGYRYDDPLAVVAPEPAPEPIATPAAVATQEARVAAETPPDQPVALGLEPSSIPLEVTTPDDTDLIRIAASEATPVAGGIAPQITLTLEGIRDLGSPAGTIGVYVNAPAGVIPDPESESFVGTISLFGLLDPMDHDGPAHGASQSFNITRAVEAAQERGDWQGEVVVTFVPQGLVPASGAVPAAETELAATLARIAEGPWITIERITVTTIE